MGKYNYSKINLVAHDYLVKQNCLNFPVNILSLIKGTKSVKIMTYDQFDKLFGRVAGVRADKRSPDGFTYYHQTVGFIIAYNNNTVPFHQQRIQRIRFTLAHELGHILLGHFNNGKPFLPRSHPDKNSIVEKEADLFAAELLAPRSLINSDWDPTDIAKYFDITDQAAKIALFYKQEYDISVEPEFSEYFTKAAYRPRKNYFHNISRNEFIRDINTSEIDSVTRTYYHFCKDCHYLNIVENHIYSFCSLCGASNLEIVQKERYFEFHETNEQIAFTNLKEIDSNMSYSELVVDEDGRLIQECPICGNDHVSNNYCSICGVYIINACSGHLDEFNIHSDSCNIKLTGSDRFCPECGAQSTFLQNGLLEQLNFKEVTDILDEDLPF